MLYKEKDEQCNEHYIIKDKDGAPIEKEALTPKKSFSAPDKCGFPHYMLKEMEEIPTVLKNTLEAHIKDGLPCFEGVDDEIFKNMIASMKHRGPTDDGMHVEDHMALLHARLTSNDIEIGKQPMHYKNYIIFAA